MKSNDTEALENCIAVFANLPVNPYVYPIKSSVKRS